MIQQSPVGRLRFVILACAAVAVLAGCDEAGDTNVSVPENQSITLTPESVTMSPGQTVQLSAAVTGVQSPRVRFVSSDPSVATVQDQGVVTAVAPGLAVVTATVDRRPDLHASARVTVREVDTVPAGPSSVSIGSIRYPDGAQVLPDSVSGRVVVRLNVEWGGAARLGVALGGRAVCGVDAPAGGGRGDVVCEIDTGRFELQGDTAAVTFPNGVQTLEAGLFTPAGVSAGATSAQLNLRNDAGLVLRIAAADSAADAQGRVWFGGALSVRVIPVAYDGARIAAVTVDLVSPAGAAPALSVDLPARAVAVESGSALVTYPAGVLPASGGLEGVVAAIRPVVLASATASGTSGPTRILRVVGAPGVGDDGTLLYDEAPPTPGTFVLAAPSTEQWVGAGYLFAAGKSGESDEVGVGGVAVRFVVLAADGAEGLTAAEVAARGRAVATADSLATTTTNTAYVAVAVVADALGNTSYSPLRTPGGGAIRFGVDRGRPSLTLLSSSPVDGSANPSNPFLFAVTDRESGVGSEPVLLRAVRTARDGLRCAVGTGGTCDPAPWATTFAVPSQDGYYTVTALGRDRAGNTSDPVSRTVVRDGGLPEIVRLALSGALAGGQPAVYEAAVSDNVELATAEYRFVYPGYANGVGIAIPFEPRRVLGAFGPERLDTVARLASSAPFVRTLYLTDASGRYSPITSYVAAAVRFQVVDQAGFAVTRDVPVASGAAGTPDGVADLGASTGPFLVSSPAEPTSVCNGAARCAASGVPSTRMLQAAISGPAGTFNNPFQAVYFFRIDRAGVVRFVGSTSRGSLVESTSGRTWTYSVTFDATGLVPQENVPIFAIGVDTGGDGLRTPDNPRLSIVE